MTKFNNQNKPSTKPFMRKNSRKTEETKLHKNRRVWILYDLLDTPLRQKDILELWRHRGRVEYEQLKKMVMAGMGGIVDTPNGERFANINDIKSSKPMQYTDGIGVSKSTMHKIIYELMDEGVLKKTFVDGKEGYCFVESSETLYKILKEFNNPSLSRNFIEELNKDLINSKYCKKLVNLNLVKKLEFYKESLTNEEMSFVLILIKISHSALLKVLKRIYSDKVWDSVLPKGPFLMDLQFLAYKDISKRYRAEETKTFTPPYPVNFKFEIKTSLETENGEFQHLSTLKRNSFSLLSEEERKREMDKTMKSFEKVHQAISGLTANFPDFDDEIDKSFGTDSPLAYEK